MARSKHAPTPLSQATMLRRSWLATLLRLSPIQRGASTPRAPTCGRCAASAAAWLAWVLHLRRGSAVVRKPSSVGWRAHRPGMLASHRLACATQVNCSDTNRVTSLVGEVADITTGLNTSVIPMVGGGKGWCASGRGAQRTNTCACERQRCVSTLAVCVPGLPMQTHCRTKHPT